MRKLDTKQTALYENEYVVALVPSVLVVETSENSIICPRHRLGARYGGKVR